MARRPLPTVGNDFKEALAYLESKYIVPRDATQEMMQIARFVHENSYSLLIWRLRLRKLEEHSQVFLNEIASDALQVLPQIMLGYGKTTKLLIRSVSENTMRHIYFSDHPIEYIRMNREPKWYISMDQLIDYAKFHPAFIKTEAKVNAIGEIASIYSDLSAGVHGRRRQDLEMRSSLRSLSYSNELARKDADLFKRCTQSANFLLGIFNKERMRKFPLEDRRAILHTMLPKARQAWISYE